MLSSERAAPQKACKPFDRDRSGTILGEGSAVFVLERLSDQKGIDRPHYGTLSGIAISSDAYSLIAPDPNGKVQTNTINQALKIGDLSPQDIDYISLHGTGTRKNDPVESRNVERALGQHARKIPLSSSKGMLGHSLGACSAIEMAKTLLAKKEGFVPPNVNLENRDAQCRLNFVRSKVQPRDIHNALILNASFGGKNSAILVTDS